MENQSVGLVVAFVAGVLSFLSPCVLPLVPSYVSFITGLSLDELESKRRIALTHAVFFIIGFTLIFLALGATATQLGRFLNQNSVWLERIGGGLIVFFGLYLLGVFRWGALARERRVYLQDKPVGYLGSTLVGLAFGAGWTPCIGPVLGAILTVSTVSPEVGSGVALLSIYSLGLGVPFVAAALFTGAFVSRMGAMRKAGGPLQVGAGIILIIMGIAMITGYLTTFSYWLLETFPVFSEIG